MPISVTDSDSASVEDIEGMTFTAQISAGTGTSPIISSLDLLSGTIWSGHVSLGNITTPPDGNQFQYQSRDLLTDLPGDFVDANGLLATLTIDTSGTLPGDYSIKLIGTKTVGRDSEFFNGLGESVFATFGEGTLSVTAAVPEPSSFALGVAAAIGLVVVTRSTLRRQAG